MRVNGLRRWGVLVAASVMMLAGSAVATTPAGAAQASQRTSLSAAGIDPLEGCFWEVEDPSYRSSTNKIRFRAHVVCSDVKAKITVILAMLINTGSGEEYANQAVETYEHTNSAPISIFFPCIGRGGSIETYRTAFRFKVYPYGNGDLREVALNSPGSLTYDCGPF